MTELEVKEYLKNCPNCWTPEHPEWKWFIDTHCKHGAVYNSHCSECLEEEDKNV
jgi:hypothetical protein